MRRVRFRDRTGYVREGDWTDGGIRAAGTTYDPGAVEILPAARPTKLVCAGANFTDHAEEMGGALPDEPWVFLKAPNAVAAHRAVVELPDDGSHVDHEAELAAVIGEQCRRVPQSAALDVVAGFTCLNDVSNRDAIDLRGGYPSFVAGKGFDGSTPIGPVVVPPEAVPVDAAIRCRVNGETRQDGSRANLHFSVAELIAHVTRTMTLEPGDVVATGTPAGVGPLDDGDAVEVEIEGIGTLSHSVARVSMDPPSP